MSIAIIRDAGYHADVIELDSNRFVKEQSFASSFKERVELALQKIVDFGSFIEGKYQIAYFLAQSGPYCLKNKDKIHII